MITCSTKSIHPQKRVATVSLLISTSFFSWSFFSIIFSPPFWAKNFTITPHWHLQPSPLKLTPYTYLQMFLSFLPPDLQNLQLKSLYDLLMKVLNTIVMYMYVIIKPLHQAILDHIKNQFMRELNTNVMAILEAIKNQFMRGLNINVYVLFTKPMICLP